jgi:hypothetical protein
MNTNVESTWVVLDKGRNCAKMHFDNSWMKLCLKYKVFFLIDKIKLKNKSLKTKMHFDSLWMKLSPKCEV